MRVIICPGNGCTDVRSANWYGHVHSELTKVGIASTCETFPDPFAAKREIWIPHIESLAGSDENIVLVGHSSGAQAALRYAETHPLKAVILVAATYTDLGDEGERQSGYYPQGEENPYDFDAMKANCPAWYQFHSDDDPFIPLSEAERIRDGLGLTDTYYMIPGRSHFFSPFPELMKVLVSLK